MQNSQNLALQLTFPEEELNPSPPQAKQCRICLSEQHESDFIHPCICSGSMKNVHFKCLSSWIKRSQPALLRNPPLQNHFSCQMCQYKIRFQCLEQSQCNTAGEISQKIQQRKILFLVLIVLTLICLGLIIAAAIVLIQSVSKQEQSFTIIILAVTITILLALLAVLIYIWVSDYFTSQVTAISKIHNYTFRSKRKKRSMSPQRTEDTLLTKTNKSMGSRLTIHPEIVLNTFN